MSMKKVYLLLLCLLMALLTSCVGTAYVGIPFQASIYILEGEPSISGTYVFQRGEDLSSFLTENALQEIEDERAKLPDFDSTQLILHIHPDQSTLFTVDHLSGNDRSWYLMLNKTSIPLENLYCIQLIETDLLNPMDVDHLEVIELEAIEISGYVHESNYHDYTFPTEFPTDTSSPYLSDNKIINCMEEFDYYVAHNPNIPNIDLDIYDETYFENHTLVIINLIEKSFTISIEEIFIDDTTVHIDLLGGGLSELSIVYHDLWIDIGKNNALTRVEIDFRKIT